MSEQRKEQAPAGSPLLRMIDGFLDRVGSEPALTEQEQQQQGLGDVLRAALVRHERVARALRELDISLTWAVAGDRPDSGIWH